MACTDDCDAPTSAQAHCSANGCHRTFGGVRAFDRHRKNGTCLDPATLGMQQDSAGRWRWLASDARKEMLAQRRAAGVGSWD